MEWSSSPSAAELKGYTEFLRQAQAQAVRLAGGLPAPRPPAASSLLCPHPSFVLACREAGAAALRFARFLERLQAHIFDLESLAPAALAASAVMFCLKHASVHATAMFGGPSQPQQPLPCGIKPLSPSEAVAACSWSTALMDNAARLLLAVAAQAERTNTPGLLGVLACCCHAADQLRHHMQRAAGLPHVAQLRDGLAHPNCMGALTVLQAALALHPNAGKCGLTAWPAGVGQQANFVLLTRCQHRQPLLGGLLLTGGFDHASHLWGVVLNYLVNIARRQSQRELDAWRATAPDAMPSLCRLALARLGSLTRQAQLPLPREQLEEVLTTAARCSLAAAPLDATEQLPPLAQWLAEPSWDYGMSTIGVLFNLQVCTTWPAWRSSSGRRPPAVTWRLCCSWRGACPAVCQAACRQASRSASTHAPWSAPGVRLLAQSPIYCWVARWHSMAHSPRVQACLQRLSTPSTASSRPATRSTGPALKGCTGRRQLRCRTRQPRQPPARR